MTDTNARYLTALRELTAWGGRFVVIGSAGLALTYPTVWEGYALPDADVLLGADLDAAASLARWLIARGWRVTVWGEEWTPSWDARALDGRIYFRAVREGLQLDATYEHPRASACVDAARWIDGVPVCPAPALWAMKRDKDPDAARAFAARFGIAMPGG